MREPNFYLGLDPGKSGGLAIIWTSGKIEVMSMAETETGIRELFPKEEL